MKENGGLAVPCFAEDEERTTGGELNRSTLRGIEGDVDERRL
jgi:hypothetical protein